MKVEKVIRTEYLIRCIVETPISNDMTIDDAIMKNASLCATDSVLHATRTNKNIKDSYVEVDSQTIKIV